jgi:dehydrogluconokinase
MPGLTEGALLTGYEDPADMAAFYLDQGVEAVMIKLGAKGAYYRTQMDQGFVAGVPVINVVDTVGAGDGFAVGVISALLENQGFAQAVARGNWIGSRAVQNRGDMEGLPLRAQLLTTEPADKPRRRPA